MQFKMLHCKLAVVGVAILVVVFAAPAPNNDVKIDHYIYKTLNDQNTYKFSYRLSDGQERTETGSLKTDANGEEKLVVSGEYEFIGTDGVLYSVFYTADENGFQAYGDHIPGTDIPGTVGAVQTDVETEQILGIAPNAIKSLIG